MPTFREPSSAFRALSRRLTQGALVLAILALVPQGASAEKQTGAATKPPPVGASGPAMPDAYKLNMLIRTTLIALSQANQTGNYSVLRDLGTPQFQAMNTDARLAEIFVGLRQRKLDFSPIVFFDPKLVRPAAIQANGLLRLTGYFETRPERILFDIGFELVNGEWRLSAIVVDMNQPTEAQPQPKQQDPPVATKTPTPKAPAKGKSLPSN